MQPEVLLPLLLGMVGIIHEVVKLFKHYINRSDEEVKRLYAERDNLQKLAEELRDEKTKLLFVIDELEDKIKRETPD